MSETKHTPLPWAAQQGGNCSRIWGYGTQPLNYPVAVCERDPIDINGTHEANAEFIVRACNAHDDLLVACKAMVQAAQQRDPALGGVAATLAEAAIAKAER